MKALGLNEPFQKAAVTVSALKGGETGNKRTPFISLPPAMMNEAGGAHWFVLALASSVDSPCPLAPHMHSCQCSFLQSHLGSDASRAQRSPPAAATLSLGRAEPTACGTPAPLPSLLAQHRMWPIFSPGRLRHREGPYFLVFSSASSSSGSLLASAGTVCSSGPWKRSRKGSGLCCSSCKLLLAQSRSTSTSLTILNGGERQSQELPTQRGESKGL